MNKRRRTKLRIQQQRDNAGAAHGTTVPAPTDDVLTLAELATNLWRAKQRILGTGNNADVPLALKKVLRPIESATENLVRLGVRTEDFTGQPFVEGMALNVVSSQPNSALQADRICETLKPTVFFRDRRVQTGDVIIEGPPSQPKTTNHSERNAQP